MEDNLIKVKNFFDEIKEIRSQIIVLFDNIEDRILKLKDIYNDFIEKTTKIKTPEFKSFIFSLDSFYFQKSILEAEYSNLKQDYKIIINRMYGEYYKLLKLVLENLDKKLINHSLNDSIKINKYPKYDDINEKHEYDFSLIIQLNEDIINIINFLINLMHNKEISLKQFTINRDSGYGVNNFVSTYNYEVVVLKEQIILYEQYLDFFYHIHLKLLNRLKLRTAILENQINSDINFEGGINLNKKNKTEIIDEMNNITLDASSLKELRKSISYSPNQNKMNSQSSCRLNNIFPDNEDEIKNMNNHEENDHKSDSSSISITKSEEENLNIILRENSIVLKDYNNLEENSDELLIEDSSQNKINLTKNQKKRLRKKMKNSISTHFLS
jgi:hypothetical protein